MSFSEAAALLWCELHKTTKLQEANDILMSKGEVRDYVIPVRDDDDKIKSILGLNLKSLAVTEAVDVRGSIDTYITPQICWRRMALL